MLDNYKNKTTPEYFDLSTTGESNLGYISIVEYPWTSPFQIKRVYWTYYTPQNIVRGFHAHKELYQLIFAVAGSIMFSTEDRFGNKNEFVLNLPNKGLFIPPLVWREIKFSHNAVLLCLASLEFKEDDYLRTYSDFLKFNNE